MENIGGGMDSKKKMMIYIGIGVGVFLLIIMVVTYMALQASGGNQAQDEQQQEQPSLIPTLDRSRNPVTKPIESNQQSSGTQPSPLILPGQEVLMEVGEEKIYQKDYDRKYESYPYKDEEGLEERLMSLLEEESVVLQGAAEEGLIELESEFFNSPNKDYALRREKVEEAEALVQQNVVSFIAGERVEMWSYNTIAPEIGYEEAREIVEEKIIDLHERVVSGELTMEEAAKIVQKDNELEKIDINYQGNAYGTFAGTKEDPLTVNESIDEILWELDEGEISDIYAVEGKSFEGDTVILFYGFAQVTEKVTNSDTQGYEDWLEEKKKQLL